MSNQQAFEQWRENPPAKYQDLFKEIDVVTKEMEKTVTELQETIDSLSSLIVQLILSRSLSFIGGESEGFNRTPSIFPFIHVSIMRKIETQMINAVRRRVTWQSGNTSVTKKPWGLEIHLFGNLIAHVTDNKLEVFDAGYQTATTKSRLNCLINALTDGSRNGIFQKHFEWFVTIDGSNHEWNGENWFPIT